jgi:hypothetical protein
MDDLGSDEGAGGKKAKGHKGSSGGSTPFWKSQGAIGALAIVAVVVLCFGIWFSFFSGGAPRPPSSMTLIDVKTGELFSIKFGKRSHVIPAKNPETGDRCVFPIEKTEDGDWIINDRYFPALEGIDFSSSVLVDVNNGTVIPSGDQRKRLH